MTYYKCGSIHPTQNSNVVVDTASGAIANFQTPLAMPLVKTRFDVNAKQDLHGYDHPWPTGGGKNILLKPFVYYSLAPNDLADMFFIKAGDYRFSFSDSTAENWRIGLRMKDAEGNDLTDVAYKPNSGMSWRSTINCWLGGSDSTTKNIQITIVEDCYIRMVFGLANTTADTKFTNVQLEKGTTQTNYEPVENICPISGVSEVKIARTGDNSNLVPFLKGLLQGKYTFVEMNSLEWTYSTYSDVNYFVTSVSLPNVKAPERAGQTANAISNKYNNVVSNGVTSPVFVNGTMFIWTTGRLFVRDTNYSDATLFKNSLQGTYLIYELAEPITPTITIEQFNTICQAFGISGEYILINLGGTYYGGHFTQDKDGHRQFEVDRKLKTVDGSTDVTVASSSYIKSDACDGYINDDEIQPRVSAEYQPDLLCNRLTQAKGNIWSNVGHADEFCINNRSIHFNISNASLGIVDYTQETTETAKAKIDAFLQNNPVVVVIPITPYVIDLPDGEPIKSLPGVNNIYADTGDTSLQFRKIG